MSFLTAERRFTVATQLEARTSGKGTIIEGYASVYDTPYEVGGFREIVAPSAFRKTSRESDIRALLTTTPTTPWAASRPGRWKSTRLTRTAGATV